MGKPETSFKCDIYLPRQRRDRSWIIDICYTLWRHGMTFSTPRMVDNTWEEQLHAIPPVPAYPTKSLIDQVDAICAGEPNRLACYDREVEFRLEIDTDLRNFEYWFSSSPEEEAARKRLSLGKFRLYVRYPVIDVDYRIPASLKGQRFPSGSMFSSAYLVPPYQQIHLAMIHWVEILCLKLRAAFAVGYYAIDSFGYIDESDFLHGFDIATVSALEQNQFPPLREWLESVYVLYVPESLTECPQATEWFSAPIMRKRPLPDGEWTREWHSVPAMWTRQLSNRGRIAYAMPETRDALRIREFNAMCKEILDQRDLTRFPLARRYLQRAQEILAITQHTEPEHIEPEIKSLLSRLEWMEQHPDLFK